MDMRSYKLSAVLAAAAFTTTGVAAADIGEKFQDVLDGFKSLFDADTIEEDAHELFEKFKNNLKKQYQDTDEEDARFLNFEKRHNKLNELKKRQNAGEFSGVTFDDTKFSDWSEEELSSLTGGLKMKTLLQDATDSFLPIRSTGGSGNDDDVTVSSGFSTSSERIGQEVRVGTNIDTASLVPQNVASTVPASWDWVDYGAVTAIKNQGSCGACWAFAGAAAIESHWQIVSGNSVDVSEQQMLDCTDPSMGCNGGWYDDCYDYAETTDVCSIDDYLREYKTWSPDKKTCRDDTCQDSDRIPAGAVTGTFELPNFADATEIKQKLYENGPLTVAVTAESDQNVWQFYQSGVLTCEDLQRWNDDDNAIIDHGVLLVGYGYDSASGKDYWKIKNSWGDDWGEDGYIRIEQGQNIDCGINLFASYPIVQNVAGFDDSNDAGNATDANCNADYCSSCESGDADRCAVCWDSLATPNADGVCVCIDDGFAIGADGLCACDDVQL